LLRPDGLELGAERAGAPPDDELRLGGGDQLRGAGAEELVERGALALPRSLRSQLLLRPEAPLDGVEAGLAVDDPPPLDWRGDQVESLSRWRGEGLDQTGAAGLEAGALR